jgi:CelD/BcsL family acetyltransferase involved in cellulose biosynthesis
MNTTANCIAAVPSTGRTAPLATRRLQSWSEIEALSSEFNSVLGDSADPTIFSTLEWLGAWWRACGQGRQLFAFSLTDPNGEYIGFAPLYSQCTGSRGLGRIARLRLVGDGTEDSDNLDLIVRSGSEGAVAEALLAHLELEPAWDICELNTLDTNSTTAQAMLDCLAKRRWPVHVSDRPGSLVQLPETWEAYLQQLSHEHASGIERYRRRLNRRYEVRIRRCATETELDQSLDVLFDLHQKRWHARGQSGSFASAERRRFYRDMSRAFLRNGWLEFWLLDLNGTSVAAQFAFRYRDTVYQLQEGVDPQHYTDRAGVVLRAHVLKTLIAEGVRSYDFLGGVDAHKKSWCAQPRPYMNISFARPRSRGAVYLSLHGHAGTARAWLRTHLPSPALRALRRLQPKEAISG